MDAFTLSGGFSVLETITQHTGTWAYRLLVPVVLGFLPLVGAVVATYRVPRSIQRRATYWVYAVSLFLFCLAWAAGGTFLTYLLGA